MEFWSVEVKPGEKIKCNPGIEKLLHLSQASLGEVKMDKGNENILLFVKCNKTRVVIGTLSTDKCAQISYDLVFEKEFELSHNWKNGSVFFVGYKTLIPEDLSDDFSGTDPESEEEDIQLSQKANGKTEAKPKPKVNAPKADSSATKPKAKAEESKKVLEEDDDDDEDDNDDDDDSNKDDSDDGDTDDEAMIDTGDDSDDEDEISDEEDEATPKKAESGKKRSALSVSKTPVPEKKAKLVTPVGSQKTGGADGKKGGHTATPYPVKHAGKTSAANDKSKQHTPKSGGSFSCKSCGKIFSSENAIVAHTKAKHTAK